MYIYVHDLTSLNDWSWWRAWRSWCKYKSYHVSCGWWHGTMP